MKSNALIIFFIILTLFFNGFSQAQTSEPEHELIKKRLKAFYVSYISESAKEIVNIKKIDAIKMKYITEKLLKKIDKEELDYDPIINAQDCDVQWLKTLEIIKSSSTTQIYIVSYTDGYSKRKNSIKLFITKEFGSFKIANIL